jgi:hypothetical protein
VEEEMEVISSADHPNAKDPTAKIVWEDRRTLDAVYSVRGGFIATLGYPNCLAPLFASQNEAVAAINRYRAA